MDALPRLWQTLAGSVSLADVILLLLRLTAIGAAGHLALALMRRGSAAMRHLVATATLAAMVATPWLGALGEKAPAIRLPLPALESEPERAPAMMRVFELADAVRPAADRVAAAVPASTAGAPLAPAAAGLRPAAADLGANLASALDLLRARGPRWSDAPAGAVVLVLMVALALIAGRLLALLSTEWIVRRAAGVDDPRIRAVLARAIERLGTPHRIVLRVTDRMQVPAVAGALRPVLLLPAAALEWDDARLFAVFVHELAHVQRRDGLGCGMAQLATALLWFHPLTWTLARAARQECERACDDVVLRAGVGASSYADELLQIARDSSGSGWSASLAFARPSSLEGRLLAILRADAQRSPATRRAGLLVALAAIALLLPIAAVRVVAEPADASNSQWGRTTTSTRTRTATVTRTGRETCESASSSCSSACPDQQTAHDASRCPQATESAGAEADARSGDEWCAKARGEYDAEQFAAAGESYEQAAAAGYDPGTAWYNAACSYARAGQKNRAVGALHQALDHGFGDSTVLQSDEDLNAMRGDRRFQMLLEAANHGRISSKDWKDERDRSRDDADIDDSDADALKEAAMWELRHGDRLRAAQLFQQEYAVDSTASALYNVACAYACGGDKDRALAALEISIYAGYGDADKLESDDDLRTIRREPRFQRLVDLADDLGFSYPSIGKWLTSSSQQEVWQRTVPRYDRIARKYPQAGRAWFNLGLAELRAGDSDASREAYLHALALGYRRGASSYNLACAAAQGGDRDEALRRLEQAADFGFDVTGTASGDDDLDPLRHDARFDRLMDRLDSEHDRGRHAKYKDKS